MQVLRSFRAAQGRPFASGVGHHVQQGIEGHDFGILLAHVEQVRLVRASTCRESVWPGRARPLCVYPAQVTYTGAGSIEKASSFTCR